jgi:hypothetical protein
MWRPVAVIVALLLGVAVLSDIAWRERRLAKEIEQLTTAGYVDMGIRLVVVERDLNGVPMVLGNPEPMRIVGEHIRGGIVKLYRDDEGNPAAHIVRPSRNPTVWFASQAQADLILHDGPVPWALVQGSEGSGKTTVLAMWVAFRVLEHIGHNREIGITAPTGPRLVHVKREIKRWWPARWYRFSERYQKYTFLAGPTVQLVSAVQRSEEGGSPIQGANWVAAAADELQDHFDRDGDIIARGRTAPGGWYPRLCTSTFKDFPAWRTFRSVAERAKISDDERRPLWNLTLLLGLQSPFISPQHWENMRAGLTEREYQRRVLAMDVGPERQVYYSWRRSIVENDNAGREVKRPGNLRQLPLGAVDVTARECARFGRNIGLVAGNDPGRRQHVTELLKAYEFQEPVGHDRNGRPLPPIVRWFVVDEVTSDVFNADRPEAPWGPVTVETHIAKVLERVQSKHKCMLRDAHTGGISADARRVLVRIDPHTTTGDTHPGRAVKSRWINAGFIAGDAAFNDSQKPTPIKVEDRIDLLNTLLCNVDNERRLYVLCDDQGRVAAPQLVSAFELMTRNEAGKAEWENKDASDRSHWPSAVAFALWLIEKPRVDLARARAA